jgi:hypothetical protein
MNIIVVCGFTVNLPSWNAIALQSQQIKTGIARRRFREMVKGALI